MDVVTGSREISIVTVEMGGRIDAVEAGSLRELLSSYLADGLSNLAVDLSRVEFIDSAGLAALVKGMKDARLAGGDLRLVAPRSNGAMRIFDLTRFDQVFTMADDLDTLLAAW